MFFLGGTPFNLNNERLHSAEAHAANRLSSGRRGRGGGEQSLAELITFPEAQRFET